MKNIKLKALLLTAICGIFGVMFGQSAWADEIVAKMESQVVLYEDGGTSKNTAPVNGTEKKSVELKYGSVKLSVDLIFAQNKQVEILCGKGTGAGPNEVVKLRVSQNQGSTKYTAETTALAGQCSGIGGEFIKQLKNAGFNVKDSIGNIGGDNTGSGTGNGGATGNGGTTGDGGTTGGGTVDSGTVVQKNPATGATILTGCWNEAENSKDGSGIRCVLTLVVDVLTVGIGVLGVLGITIVGIQYLTAGGSEEQTRKAKRRLFEIIIGLVAYVLIYALLKFLMPNFG